MEDCTEFASTLHVSDLTSNGSDSGHLPELTLGLSLTDTHTDVTTRPPERSFHGNHPSPPLLVAWCNERAERDLAQEYPGVNKVLREVSAMLNTPRVPCRHGNIQTNDRRGITPCQPHIDHTHSIPPIPLLSLPPDRPNPQTTPLLTNPPRHPIVLTSGEPHPLEQERTLILPEVPLRPFVPQLIDPKELQRHNGEEGKWPPLLHMTDPLNDMRRRGQLELLSLPREREVTIVDAPLQKPRPLVTISKDLSSKNNPRSRKHSKNVRNSKATPTCDKGVWYPPVVEDPPIKDMSPSVPVIATPTDSEDECPATPTTPSTSTHSLPITPPTSCSNPPNVPLSPPSQSVAIQVDSPGQLSASVQIGSPSLNQSPIHSVGGVSPNQRYLAIADIDNESEGSEDIDKESGVEGATVLSLDMGVVSGRVIPPDDDIIGRFRCLEQQLALIENRASDIRDEFDHSRKVLHTIDRLSTGPVSRREAVPLGAWQGEELEGRTLSPPPSSPVPNPSPVHNRDHEDVAVDTHREELRGWMERKRKERMAEYKRTRESLVAKERVPYTPRHDNQVSCPDSVRGRSRSRGVSDRNARVQDAKNLLEDLLTSTQATPTSLNDSVKSSLLLNTLPRHASSLSTVINEVPRPSSADNPNGRRERRREKREGRRCLSSVEGLDVSEQLKITEILRSVDSTDCVNSAESSIDWSHVDRLLLST